MKRRFFSPHPPHRLSLDPTLTCEWDILSAQFSPFPRPLRPLPATISLLTFAPTHSLCYFANDIMFRACRPSDLLLRKWGAGVFKYKAERKGASEWEWEAGGGGVSTQRSINSAVSRDAEWKRKRGGGRTGEAREEGEALEWDEGLRVGDVKKKKKRKTAVMDDIAED